MWLEDMPREAFAPSNPALNIPETPDDAPDDAADEEPRKRPGVGVGVLVGRAGRCGQVLVVR